eukprot:2010680-Pyramimonas_sp.AAC.1
MLAWELKCAICGDRTDCQVNMDSCVRVLRWASQSSPLAAAPPRARRCARGARSAYRPQRK